MQFLQRLESLRAVNEEDDDLLGDEEVQDNGLACEGFIRDGYSVDNRGQQSVVAEGSQVRSGIETESRSAAY
jgi:hypothetical protein